MKSKSPGFSKFRKTRRQAVRVSDASLVERSHVNDARLPLVISPAMESVDLGSWAEGHRDEVMDDLHRHGAVLFRGFGLDTVEAFQDVARAISGELLDYEERAAPRREVGKSVFTSTEYPADQWIPMHHEMSYSHNWPTRLFFYCETPPTSRGRTPLTDDRTLIDAIDPQIKEEFLVKKVMYVRNYGEGVDMPWQEVFQTEDRAEVEEYCRKARMTVEWRGEDRLRTRAVRQVTATHPETGDTVWFNHAHMFHVSNMPVEVRESLLAEFEPDELPRNAFYGDGTPISDEVAEAIRSLYRERAVGFDWQQGDLMVVDNFLASHGREPFEGPRRILVAMAELFTSEEL